MDCERENGWKALPAQPPRLCIGRRVSPQSSYCGGSYRRLLPDRLVQAGIRAPSSHGLLLLLGARKKKKVAGPTALFHAISGAFRRRTCSPMVAARCLDAPASVGLTGPHARGFHTHLHSASLPRAPIRAYKRDCIGLHRNVPQSQVCPRCKARQISGKIKLPKPETQIRSTRHAPHGRLSGTADEQRPCLCPSRSICHPNPPHRPVLARLYAPAKKKSVCGYHQHTSHHHPAPWSRARSLPANPANTV